MTMVERLIREFGVAVIPGTTFGLTAAVTCAWRTERWSENRLPKESAGWCAA